MKQKKLVSLVLSLTLVLGLALPAHGEGAERPFPDVEGHWAQGIIEKWHSFGVIGGDTVTGTFRPDDPLSRAEFATLLNRIMGYPLVEIKHFHDVPADSWYAETMSRLNAAGILQGDGNDMIRPKDPVTRQEAAVILCRALGIEEQKANTHFHDADEIASWAEGAVGALYNMGAIQGWEGYFDPQDPISRVQAVTLLNNLIAGVMTQPGTWNQNVDGDLYICTKRAKLENMTVSGDLILTPGIDTGDVSLSGVTVKGDVIVRGCGEKSLHIQSGCHLERDMIVAKTIDGVLRVVNESDTPIPSIQVEDGRSTVILEGDISSVAVNCDVPVIFRNGKVENLSVSAAKADLTVEKGHTVSTLTTEKEAKETKLAVEGTVNALAVNASATVNNTGKIVSAHAAANGLTLAGTKPVKITVASGVSKPLDGNGKSISSATTASNSGTSSSSGRSPSGSSNSGSASSSSNSGSSSPAAPTSSLDLTNLEVSPELDASLMYDISIRNIAVKAAGAAKRLFFQGTLYYETADGTPGSITGSRDYHTNGTTQNFSIPFHYPYAPSLDNVTVTKVSISCSIDGKEPIYAEHTFTSPVAISYRNSIRTDPNYDPSTIPGAPPKDYEVPTRASCVVTGTSDLSAVVLQGFPDFTGQTAAPYYCLLEFRANRSGDDLGTLLINAVVTNLGEPAVSNGNLMIGAGGSGNWNFQFKPIFSTIIDNIRDSSQGVYARLTYIWRLTDVNGNYYFISLFDGYIDVSVN